jgi:hypothetical protein
MTKANIPLQLMNELYRSYDFLNTHFCEGKLPRPIIIITRDTKRKAHGWFSGDAWNHQSEKVSEIALCASSFAKGDDEVFDTLLHEMAHLKNFYENDCKIVDCSEQQRHNQIFKISAEFFGLKVTSSKRFGPAHTQLDTAAHEAITKLKPNKKLFSLYAEMQTKDKKEKKESKLTPTMVDKDTKAKILAAAEQLGISQKEVVQNAVNLLVELPNKIDNLADLIFGKKFKTIEELKQIIIKNLS